MHWWRAGNAHGLHSPFVYDLYTRVLRPSKHANGPVVTLDLARVEAIEAQRNRMLASNQQLEVHDYGAPAKGNPDGVWVRRRVATIARSALKSKDWVQVLARLVQHRQPTTILELGTSLGTTTAYLALAGGAVVTIEGDDGVASVAQEVWHQLGLKNITCHTGNLDLILAPILAQHYAHKALDFAFLDANHTYEATMRYFLALEPYLHTGSCVVLDDIHWSAGMHKAWQTIIARPCVTVSVDMGQIGLLFFHKGQEPQHFCLR